MKLSPKLSPKRNRQKISSNGRPPKNGSFETIGGVYSTSIILAVDDDGDDGNGVPASLVPVLGGEDQKMTYSYLTDMANKLKNGLDIRDRTHRLKTYKRCFVASEAVDFMIKNRWVQTREEAVKLGRRLQNALGLWHHVCDDHDFKDEYLFFEFYSNGNNNDEDSKRKNNNKNSAKAKGIPLPPPPLDDDGDSTTELSTGMESSTNSGGIDYWMSSGLEDHHLNAPKFVPRRSMMKSMAVDVADLNLDGVEEELLGHVMMRSRISLPNTRSGYKTFHILINEERTKKDIAPLARNQVLDEFARDHAKNMANSNQLCHCNPIQLQNVFGRESSRFGENIIKGKNTEEIYESMKTNSVSDMNNILDRRFTHLGVGTAKGGDGLLYVCHIFRGE